MSPRKASRRSPKRSPRKRSPPKRSPRKSPAKRSSRRSPRKSSPMRFGWVADAPKSQRDRREVRQKCGPDCFMMPKELKFPICPKCRDGACSCQEDCRGLLSAHVWGRHHGYHEVANRADRKARSSGCHWARKLK